MSYQHLCVALSSVALCVGSYWVGSHSFGTHHHPHYDHPHYRVRRLRCWRYSDGSHSHFHNHRTHLVWTQRVRHHSERPTYYDYCYLHYCLRQYLRVVLVSTDYCCYYRRCRHYCRCCCHSVLSA